MKAAQLAPTATSAKNNTQFFKKENEQGFFHSSENEQPFFSKSRNNNYGIQTKLTVGAPNDVYEKEADTMADKVVQRLAQPEIGTKNENAVQAKPVSPAFTPFVQTKCAHCEEEEKIQKKEREEDKLLNGKLQKKPIFESDSEPPEEDSLSLGKGRGEAVQRKCAACAKEESVQKKGDNSSESTSPGIEARLNSSKGSGSALPTATREQMESSLGANFSTVKIHNDSSAVQMSQDLNAQAFTHGNDIYFNSGKYDANSKGGKHLLAHELTHVVQQNGKVALQKFTKGGIIPVRSNSNNEKSGERAASSKSPGTSNTAELSKALENEFSDMEKDAMPKDREHEVKKTHSEDKPQNPGNQNNPNNQIGSRLYGKVPNVSEIQRVPDIQKDGVNNIKDLNDAGLKALGDVKEGYLSKINGKVEVHFKKFPSKQYIGPFVNSDNSGNQFLVNPPFKKPTVERKTKQRSVWLKDALPLVTAALQKIISEKQVTGPEYRMDLVKKKNIAVTGTLEQIAKQVVVPFWGMDGLPVNYQIEHKVDWQIAGGNANVDVISNLILLDEKSNISIGQTILSNMKLYYKKVIDYFTKEKKVEGLAQEFAEGTGVYDIFCDDLFSEGQAVKGSLISISNLENKATQNPISSSLINISDVTIPPGYFILKTAKSGAGLLAPLNLDNEFLKIVGEEKDNKTVLKSMTLKNVIKDDQGNLDTANPDKNLKFYQDGGNGRYKIDTEGYAAVLKTMFKGLKAMSPIEWSDIDFNPLTGWNANATIKPSIPFLENATINISLQNSVFVLEGAITSDLLKDKLPKPFQVTYCSLLFSASSNKGFSAGGEIGFNIKDFGEGKVSASAGPKWFALSGEFSLDKKLFKGTINAGFKKQNENDPGTWTFGGTVVIDKNKIKGLDSLTVSFTKDETSITGKGTALLSIPGVKKIDILAKAENDGQFTIGGEVDFGKIPKLESATGNFKISKLDDGWDIEISGNVKPKIDIPGLNINEIAVKYQKGVFDISTKVHYEKGRVSGDITVGVTNNPVNENGQKQEGDGGKEMKFYADGTINVEIATGVGGLVHIKMKPNDGDILLDGKVELTQDKPLFTPQNLDKTIFELNENIPLASCVVVTLSLHLGGHIRIYAHLQPLTFDKGSYIALTDVSLKNFSQAKITSELNISSHLDAGIDLGLELGLDASLLGIVHATVTGTGDLDFRALDADAHAFFKAGWSAENGVQLEDGKVDFDLSSKLIATLGAKIRVYADLLITTIDIWEHNWEFARKEVGVRLFGDGKIVFPLPIAKNGGVALPPDSMENNLGAVKTAGDPKKVAEKSKGFLENDGETPQDKQAAADSIIKKAILDKFRDPQRLVFNKSEDYLQTRYSLLNYLRSKKAFEKNIDLSYVEDEIKKAEFEEYEAFGPYIASETFDADTKYILVDDFIRNHPTLGETERMNLRSNVVKDKIQKGKSPAGAQKKEQNEAQTSGLSGTNADRQSNSHSLKSTDFVSHEENDFEEIVDNSNIRLAADNQEFKEL